MKTTKLFRQDEQNFAGFFYERGGALILSLLLILSTLTGCATKPGAPATPPTQTELDRVQMISEEVAFTGTTEALIENPSWRPQFEATWTALDQAMTDGHINDVDLHNIISTLPIEQLKSRDVRLAITGARLIYYAAGGNLTMIDTQSRAWAAALGIRDGMGRALGKTLTK